jgi:hypothetical protein
MALSSNEDLLVASGKICSVRIASQLFHDIHEVLFYQIVENYVDESPKVVSADAYFESCDFSRENTNIETYRCTIYPCFCLI